MSIRTPVLQIFLRRTVPRFSKTRYRHIAFFVKMENKWYFIRKLKKFIVYSNKWPLQDRQPLFFGRYELVEGTFNHQTTECRYPTVLPSLTNIASNNTAYSNLLIIDCKSAYYVEILLRLGGAVCRERPEMWPTVGYMKLCVDRDRKCGRELVTCSCV
jgi:hypothetical protein